MNVQTPRKHFGRFDRAVTTKRIRLTDNRLDRLQPFFKHGLLSTEMLHALVEPEKAQNYTTEELKRLKRIPNSYLEQPEAQQDTIDALYNRLIYRLSLRGIEGLLTGDRITIDDARLWRNLRSQHKENQFWHDAATGYITASIELGCKQIGLKFLSVYDILRGRDITLLALPYQKSHLIPDALFGISDGTSTSYFALETDMGSEQLEANQIKHSTLAGKYLGSRHMWYHELYKNVYGIPSLKLLIVTTKHLRLENIKTTFAALARNDAQSSGTGPVYLRCLPALERRQRLPLPATGMMLLDPWQRVSKEPTLLYKTKTAA
jgi:hypothetical protein